MSQPLFVRRLTRTERVKTKRLQRKSPSLAVDLRVQAVLLSRQGRTVQEIGDIVGRNRSTVFRWLQSFDERGLDSLHPGKSPGAPRKVSLGGGSCAAMIAASLCRPLRVVTCEFWGKLKIYIQPVPLIARQGLTPCAAPTPNIRYAEIHRPPTPIRPARRGGDSPGP